MPKKTDKILNEIHTVRASNNDNWMGILKLAFKHAPEESKEILERIVKKDKEIVSLCEKIINKR